jgi:hypothetical protein
MWKFSEWKIWNPSMEKLCYFCNESKFWLKREIFKEMKINHIIYFKHLAEMFAKCFHMKIIWRESRISGYYKNMKADINTVISILLLMLNQQFVCLPISMREFLILFLNNCSFYKALLDAMERNKYIRNDTFVFI